MRDSVKPLFIACCAALVVACGSGGDGSTHSMAPTVLPTLPPNGAVLALSGGARGTLTFSSNDAPAETTVKIAPVPAPTPKWPLPEQVAGYTVTLNHTVTFTAFPPSMCISGSFGPDRSYEVNVLDPNGYTIAKVAGTVSASGVCAPSLKLQGQIQANSPYTFTMMMSSQ